MPWGSPVRTVPATWRAQLRRVDPAVYRRIATLGPYRPTRQPATFATLCEAILYQQLAGAAAATIHRRFVALFPGHRFPKPNHVVRTPIAKLRSAGLSRAKALAVKDLARKTIDGTVALATLRHLDDGAVKEHLVRVRGIGPWTAEMFLLFALGRPDVFPLDDYGVVKGFAALTGMRGLPSKRTMARRAEKWRPYRSVVAWYCWRIVDGSTPGR